MLSNVYNTDIHNYIPRLIFLEKQVPVRNKKVNLYRLNWEHANNYKKHKFRQFHQKEMPPILPPKYEERILELTYAIPHNYLTEIRRLSLLHYTEKLRPKNFDTAIREVISEVANAAMNSALALISDCIYDHNTQSYFRSDDIYNKPILERLTRYYFWHTYVGRGTAMILADIHTPKEYFNKKYTEQSNKIIKDIIEWAKEQEKHYREISTEKIITTSHSKTSDHHTS